MFAIIGYFAFGGNSHTAKFELPDHFYFLNEEEIAEELFKATNLQEGPVWKSIEASLPAERTHTSMSVGDSIYINYDRDHVALVDCKPQGWVVAK